MFNYVKSMMTSETWHCLTTAYADPVDYTLGSTSAGWCQQPWLPQASHLQTVATGFGLIMGIKQFLLKTENPRTQTVAYVYANKCSKIDGMTE